MPHQLEVRLAQEPRDVGFLAGEEIIDAHDIVPFVDQPLAQLRPQEPGAAGDQNAFNFSCHERASSGSCMPAQRFHDVDRASDSIIAHAIAR